MRYLAVLFAIICGVVLVIKPDTGTLDPGQIAGIGLILLGVAFFLPAAWLRMPHD